MPWHLGQVARNNVSEGVAENSSYNSLFLSASLLKGVKYCRCTRGNEELLTYRRPPTSSHTSSQRYLKLATFGLGCWVDAAHEGGREPEILEVPVQKDFSQV